MDEIIHFKEQSKVKTHILVQYIQIYNEKITDLLSGNDVFLRDSVLKNSSEVNINNLKDFLALLAIGERRKK